MNAWKTCLLVGIAASLAGCLGDIGDGEEDEGGGPGGPVLDGASCDQAQVGAPVLRRLSAVELDNTLRDVFPEATAQWEGVKLGPDPASHLGFTNDAETLKVGEQTAKELLRTAEDVAERLTADAALSSLLPCAASQPGPECAGEFVTKYGYRLFRRPVSDGEKTRYVSLFSSVSGRSDFRRGMKWMMVAMLQSPNAVYRSEIGVPDGGRYELSQYEIATELAYSFAGTAPDQELLDRAGRGELDSPEALADEARRLLDSPRGREAVNRFMNQWVGYERVRGIAKLHAQNFEHISGLMVEETRRFLDEILYNQGAGMRELLTAPYTFVNAELAQFYGFGGASGDFQRVDRPEDRGVGLLAHGSILAAHAHSDSSSPTQRGLLIFERLLCGEIPPPPKNIKPIDAPQLGQITTRQRYEEAHTAPAECATCHVQFDPSGFALEHFDEAGRFRADEGGLAIDDSGYIVVRGERVQVDGAKGLAEALASTPQVTECAGHLAATFAYGGALGAQCAIEGAQQGLVAEEYGLLEYFARLAMTEHMRYRVRRE